MNLTVTTTFNPGNLDPSRFIARSAEILRAYDAVIFPAFKEEIKAAQFSWPRPTKRRNGDTVTSPRDIVDTGDFLSSQFRRQEAPLSLRLTYTWGGRGTGVNYAGYILTGIPSRGYPGRDWIKPVFTDHPLDRFFATNWRRLAGAPNKPPKP
ncbi:MAG: hypothetical protein EBR86_14985 [Planctomycetia bacterium]|nr:hypothetical protein [Planctomycetia bacterium]